MFNWTTTTIVNSLKDSSGKDLVTVNTSDSSNPILRIKRDRTFEKKYITKVYHKAPEEAVLCKMSIDVDALVTAIKTYVTNSGITTYPLSGRLAFYIALEGSEESIYANDFYQKGKPFSVGFSFTSTTTAESLAKQLISNAQKYGIITYGKKVFDLSYAAGSDDGTATAATLTLAGTHEYQRIKAAAVLMDENISEVAIAEFKDGADESKIFTLEERGANGFGTYDQLTKDLRLPTVDRMHWMAVKHDDVPVVGGKYHQYILTYCAPSLAQPALTTVGEVNNSRTTHVYWVNDTVNDDFKTSLVSVVGAEGTAGSGSVFEAAE